MDLAVTSHVQLVRGKTEREREADVFGSPDPGPRWRVTAAAAESPSTAWNWEHAVGVWTACIVTTPRDDWTNSASVSRSRRTAPFIFIHAPSFAPLSSLSLSSNSATSDYWHLQSSRPYRKHFLLFLSPRLTTQTNNAKEQTRPVSHSVCQDRKTDAEPNKIHLLAPKITPLTLVQLELCGTVYNRLFCMNLSLSKKCSFSFFTRSET